ncbi:hypothetical protein EBR21_02280 [bacterium]|nr:hypothetical protein [bacterium]
MVRKKPFRPEQTESYFLRLSSFLLLVGGSSTVLSSCIVRNPETQDSMPESEFIQLQSNCGKSRNFLFADVQDNIPGRNEKNWGCWYAAAADKVYGIPSQTELKSMFASAKPIARHYVNLNTLTSRLNDIDKQRTTILWLGTGIALLGCGVATAGTMGIALAACALLGSATAGYDMLGGDPSQGASEAWRKMATMSDTEVTKLECNAIQTISEQVRFIDMGGLPKSEGTSRVSCPKVATLINKTDQIRGIQPGPSEIKVKNIKPTINR